MRKQTPAGTARSFLTDSEAFLVAAEIIERSGKPAPFGPKYYLACHAIELILKAFILTNGGAERELFKIGHDLLEAWNRATELGLTPADPRIQEVVEMLAPYHLDHRFRYRRTGFLTVPDGADLLEPIKALIHRIGPAVDRAMRAEINARSSHTSKTEDAETKRQ